MTGNGSNGLTPSPLSFEGLKPADGPTPTSPVKAQPDALDALLATIRATTATVTKMAARVEAEKGLKPRFPVRTLGMVVKSLHAEREAGPLALLPTPWEGVNRLLGGGVAPGELIYLGARPGAGKSAFALEWARHAARLPKPVLIVSREMRGEALARRLIAREGQIRSWALRAGALSWEECAALDATETTLSGWPVWISDTAATVEQIAEVCDSPDVAPPALLIVDYLQLLKPAPGQKDRRLQVEGLSQGLKGVALARHIPVLCLSSLSRGLDPRQPPSLASLRESGELEHDADIVLFLHRPTPDDERRDCLVAKNRDGRLGRVPLHFSGDFQQFTEENDHDEDATAHVSRGAHRRIGSRLPGGD